MRFGILLSYLIFFLGKILTFRNNIKLIVHPLTKDRLNKKLPLIFVFWHHDIPLFIFFFKNTGYYPLISYSKDGQLLIPILNRFKYGVIRGSSTRGNLNALKTGIKILKEGKSIVLTPDGPLGPRYSFKKGAIYYAKNTGVPIVPVSSALQNKWIVNSWDKMEIPKPFGLGVISMGPPIFIEKTGNIDHKILSVKNKLLDLEKKSENILAKRISIYRKK
ncbi:lysophospholipid acyltransferase family protein [bacterium]|nr:lysophospholipid acyltransferase family protein [bacterium]